MGFFDRLLGRPMDKTAFAQAVAKILTEGGRTVKSIDPISQRIDLEDGSTVFLDNVYSQYEAAKADLRPAILENFAKAFAQSEALPATYEEARGQLMPILRASSYNSLVGLQLKVQGESDAKIAAFRGAQRALSGELMVGIAFDTERSLLQVNEVQLSEWGVSLDQVLNDALDNLRSRTDDVLIQETASGVFRGLWGDSYESARLLLSDLIYRRAPGAEPICFVPSRNEFWLTDRGNIDAIKALLRESEDKHSAPYSLASVPFLLSDSGLQPFAGDDDESRLLIRRMAMQGQGRAYAQQKELLEAIYAREKRDVFVASFTVYEDEETGQWRSACVWSKDVPSVLPKTEQVRLYIPGDPVPIITVTWGRLLEVVGGLLRRDDELEPERYIVTTFPNDAQLAELRKDAGRE